MKTVSDTEATNRLDAILDVHSPARSTGETGDHVLANYNWANTAPRLEA